MPLKTPKTSVLTCTFNMGRHLPLALRSLLRQTSKDFEWLIVDDGSSDDSAEVLREFSQYSFVRFFRSRQRLGLSEARNFLLAESRGEFISILDADDFLGRRKLEEHAHRLTRDPKVGVVWGRTLMLHSDGSWEILPSKTPLPNWDIISDYTASHSATTWRRSALLRAGGYDPDAVLVEGPDMFLKVGDDWTQEFCEGVACMKRVNPDNNFRKALTGENRERWNRYLLMSTLKRRKLGLASPDSKNHFR